MIDLTPFDNSVWLAEPSVFRQAIARVRAHGDRCFSRADVLNAHRADIARAKALAGEAIVSRGGYEMRSNAGAAAIDRYLAKLEAELETGELAQAANAGASPSKAIRPTAAGKKVGVIGVYGPLQQHTSSELLKAGGTSIDFVSYAFDVLMGDPSVGAIVFHMDTPGGSNFGVMELADKIAAARASKPSYAIADSMACSAGYWLASAAGMVVCTPSGLVGSVGVFVLHVDQTKAMEQGGITITPISAGKYKTEQFGPLTDDAKANVQKYVDAIYSDFVGALASNRGTGVDDVRQNYGQGRVMTADDALAAGMIDRVMSMEDLMTKLTGGDAGKIQPSRGASAEVLRLRHELDLAEEQS